MSAEIQAQAEGDDGEGYNTLAESQARAVIASQPQPKGTGQYFDAFLCRAWGETDRTSAELVTDWAGVRAFMVREWTGSEDATADDGTNYLDELKEEFDAHEEDQRGGAYTITFEIGGVSVERVAGFAAQAPAPAQATDTTALRELADAALLAAMKDGRHPNAKNNEALGIARQDLFAAIGRAGTASSPAVGAEVPRRLIDDSDFGWTG